MKKRALLMTRSSLPRFTVDEISQLSPAQGFVARGVVGHENTISGGKGRRDRDQFDGS